MDIFEKVNEFISNLFGIKGPYVKLVVSTIVVILFFWSGINIIMKKINGGSKNE